MQAQATLNQPSRGNLNSSLIVERPNGLHPAQSTLSLNRSID
jgi:hypothetical protein